MNAVEFREECSAKSVDDSDGERCTTERDRKKRKELRRIQSVTISRVPPSDQVDREGKYATLRCRRVTTTDHLSPVRGRFHQDEDRTSQEAQSSAFAEIDLSKEKNLLRRELRNLYHILNECIHDPSLGIAVSGSKRATSLTARKRGYSDQSVPVLIQLVERAAALEITGVFTDHGNWISMHKLLSKIDRLMEVNHYFNQLLGDQNRALLGKTIERQLEEPSKRNQKVDVDKLQLPSEAEDLADEDKRVVRLLQRLYPFGKPDKGHVDPVKLLLTYPKYVSTVRLFELILILMEASDEDVPPLQKQRLLCFCRVWTSRKYHWDKIFKQKVLSRLQRIVKVGISTKDPVTVDLSNELSSRIMSAPLHVRRYWFEEGGENVDRLIKELDQKNMAATAQIIAEDCFRISQGLVLNIPLYELLMKPSETTYSKAFAEYFEYLSHYVSQTILAPVVKQGATKGIGSVYQRIEFWIIVAESLKKMGDYHSGLAVVSGLNASAISRLFCKNTTSSPQSTDKRVSKRLFKKWCNLDNFFSPTGKFGQISAEMVERQEKKLPVIPYLGLFYMDYNHANDGNRELIEGEINLEKLDVIAKLLKILWSEIEVVRKRRKKDQSKIRLQTDLRGQLERAAKGDQPDLWEISTMIKAVGK